MSILHVQQIATKVTELFESKLDLRDLSEQDPQRGDKVLTRALSAYAVYFETGCSIDDAANSVVDGGDDNGLDAIYYSTNLKRFIIVQSKWIKNGHGEPDSAAVSKYCDGIRDLFNSNFDRFNQKIQSKQPTIEKALYEYDTKYTLLLIDTGDSGLAIHSQRKIDDLLLEMNSAGEGTTEELVQFKRMNQAKIHESLAKSAGSEPIDLEMGLSNWGKISEPNTGFYGILSGSEVAQWWITYRRTLFEKNIRQVLGSTEVNAEITLTLKNKPEHFWYFNNGITILADKIEKSMIGGQTRDTGSFKLTNAQIVNGAQTVSSIGNFFESGGNVDLVKLHARIISLDEGEEGFGAKITKTNNRQNRIENRDFVSQDSEQLRIKTELSIEEIDYNIVRSDTYRSSPNSFDLNEATTALACATCDLTMAVQAKREIGKFYEDITKGIYKRLYNANTNGLYVFNCVKIQRFVELKLNEKIQNLPRKSGKLYGLLVHGNRMILLLLFQRMGLKIQLEQHDFVLDEVTALRELDNIIHSLEEKIQSDYQESMLGTLFKNASKCQDIFDTCKN